MEERRNVRQRVASIFELPGDVMLDVARITMIGDMELLIENHRGIVEYEPGQVVLAAPHARITVIGEALEIGSISPDQITILGKIRAVQYSD